ncbi:MAG: RNA polymerase sporulation sigma factor SigH [Clostridia bacterium]|nr:RNA polymerase sporulation sigma factor SigH [Clostridia bacterium]
MKLLDEINDKAGQDFSAMEDEKVIESARSGNSEALDFILNKYKPLVKSKSRAYFLIGADNEDIIQEGMIGLYKAVRDFNPEKHASFRAFADLCVNRQIITAIKAATRQKHQPLNNYVSLNKPAYDDDSQETYMDSIKGAENINPETMFIGREARAGIEKHLEKNLSSFENTVLSLYLDGKSYSEISKITQKSEKSIDNALQRVKKKLEKYLEE